jgi:pimeloyl-ACP methyl ester carboxylesterase
MLPLVLLPGTLCDARVWHNVVLALPEGIQVLRPALGRSQRWDEELKSLLSELPPCFDLAGFSLGGIAALALARKAPERVGRMILVASTSRADPVVTQERRRELCEEAYQAGGPASLAMKQVVEPDASLLGSSALSLIGKMASEMPLEQFSCQTELACTRSDSREWLKSAPMPVRIIYGDADPFCPPDRQQEMFDLVPVGDAKVIAGGGHWLPLSHPEKLAAWLID